MHLLRQAVTHKREQIEGEGKHKVQYNYNAPLKKKLNNASQCS